MYDEVATKCIAACTGLSAFVIALLANFFVNNPLDVAVGRAILAMLACSALGYIVGYAMTMRVNQAIMKRAEAAKAASQSAARAAREAARNAPKEAILEL